EERASQDVSRLGQSARGAPGAAGAAASLHVVDEHRSKIDQYLSPRDDVNIIPDFPIAGLVGTAIPAAQSFQALIGVPARVEIDVFVNRVLAVAVNGS